MKPKCRVHFVCSESWSHHDPRHAEEHSAQCVERLLTVRHASLPLQPLPVHAHVPLGELVDNLHESWHHGVQVVG